jgi:hypothetical protein
MSNIVLRQNDLFLGEDWRVVYTAFNNINFKNYSFDSIKRSLIDYIRINYPEDFTDWTENSEFVMIIDLLAYLGETLSYRIDLNARDNIIDTAERRESILRLAKMISYNPKRNMPARGKVKLRSVKTSQIVLDSEGRNLQNRIILWNDPQNPDWFEQFILILNSSLVSSNPFGRPVKSLRTSQANMQLYRMNSVPRTDLVLKFTATVSGEAMDFEIVNPDFDEFGNIYERHPNPDEAKHIIYMNDGSGNASNNTGFFLYFKQGTLDFDNYNFDKPIENRVLNIDLENVNEMDVWVSKINENGTLVKTWKKVPTIDNIVYNSIPTETRDIFAVQTQENDKISIRFSDGRFGTVPKGLYRVWQRVSNGLEYTINPQEMRGKTVTFEYKNNSGVDKDSDYDLNVVFDLFDTIRNSSETEDSDEIKERAPRVYYTQNRMTNGEDYNSFPLTFGPQITKLKSVNRVYSGQSLYFNNSDPTKRFSSTVEFGDDGIVYKEDYSKFTNEPLPTNKTPSQLITTNILPLLQDEDLYNFFLDRYKPINIAPTSDITINQGGFYWNKVSGQATVSTGYVSDTLNGTNLFLSPSEPSPRNQFATGAYLYFEEPVPLDPVTSLLDTNFKPKGKWARIISLISGGIYDSPNPTGPIVIDEYIPDDWRIKKVIPAFKQVFTNNEILAIEAQLENNNTFGIRYDTTENIWKIIDEINVSSENSAFSTQFAGDAADQNRDASWLIRVQFTGNEYRFVVRLMRYVFESEKITRFFINNEQRGIFGDRNKVNRSYVNILGLNKDLTTNSLIDRDIKFSLSKSIRYADGFIEPRRVQIVPFDSDRDGSFDEPNSFDFLTNTTSGSTINTLVFYRKILDHLGFESYEPSDKILVGNTLAQLTFYDWTINPDGYIIGFNFANKRFYQWNQILTQLVILPIDQDDYKFYVGRNNLNYKYIHLAPENNRIDPAVTNVIDTYVLTSAYNKIVTEWKNGDRTKSFPQPELPIVLQDTYSGLDEFKMMSDQLIWNAATFTLLFGDEALPENQAVFKVVKIESSSLTDNQIKQGVLTAIEEYFDLKNWSFGEIIFTSELLAYIHKQMINHVASIVIVPKQKNIFGIRHPGDIYQIRLEFNSLPLSTATVNDIIIIPAVTKANVIT